tara:strand:+ start:907 stop:1143 length:237 start_codon:yes stop_codon:yes gene_type:complete
MFGSPNRTSLISEPFLARTADFFDFPGVRFGLLYPAKVSPLYLIRPEGSFFTSLVVAINSHPTGGHHGPVNLKTQKSG